MNKFYLLFLAIVVIFIIAFTGCGEAFIARPYNMSLYIDNETNNEYLIYVDNSFTDITIVSVKGNKKDFLIKEFPGPFETWDHEIIDKYNIYIYNIVDSTYVHFIDNEILQIDNKTTADGRVFVKQFHTVDRIRPFKYLVEHEWKYTINDSLVKLMVKNTDLTNRVFKLKK
jgi:nitrogen regulatory protein PII